MLYVKVIFSPLSSCKLTLVSWGVKDGRKNKKIKFHRLASWQLVLLQMLFVSVVLWFQASSNPENLSCNISWRGRSTKQVHSLLLNEAFVKLTFFDSFYRSFFRKTFPFGGVFLKASKLIHSRRVSLSHFLWWVWSKDYVQYFRLKVTYFIRLLPCLTEWLEALSLVWDKRLRTRDYMIRMWSQMNHITLVFVVFQHT